MFWAAVSACSKSPLFEIRGTVTGESYVALLKENFFPWLRRQKKGRFVFQQDNAPAHTSRQTKQFLEDEDIDCLSWPPYSPDLSPIENLWGILKRKVDARKPDSIESLRIVAVDEWNKIPLKIVQNCISSMPNRLASVIRSNGAIVAY